MAEVFTASGETQAGQWKGHGEPQEREVQSDPQAVPGVLQHVYRGQEEGEPGRVAASV